MPYHGIHATDDTTPSDDELAALFALLDRIPRSALPDGADRDALARCIRLGDIDNLYTPFGAPDDWLIAWSTPSWVDPRQRLSEWLELRRAQASEAPSWELPQ